MFGLTWKELIILVAVLTAVITLIIALVRNSVRIVIAVVLCAILFGGFTWLPEKIKQWTGAENNPIPINQYIDTDILINNLNETKNKINTYVENNKDSWIAAWNSLWEKLSNSKE